MVSSKSHGAIHGKGYSAYESPNTRQRRKERTLTRQILKLKKPRTLLKLNDNQSAVKTSKKEAKQPIKKKIPKFDSTPKIKYAVLKKQRKALMPILEENHPDLFPPEGTPPKPWKMHLSQDVKKRYGVTKRVAKTTLNHWQFRNKEVYRAVLIPGADRYDLDGNTHGIVINAWYDMEKDVKEKTSDVLNTCEPTKE